MTNVSVNLQSVAVAFLMISVSVQAFAADREETPHGDWVHVAKTDPLTDKKSHLAFVYDESSNPNGAIVFQCDKAGDPELGRPYVKYLQQGTFFGNNGQRPVKYRIDDRPLVETLWVLARKEIVNFDDTGVRQLAGALNGGTTLILEAIDWKHQAHRNTFSLKGASDAVTAVMEGCAGMN